MLSSLFLLNSHGEVIIEMQYREKVPRATLDSFWDTCIRSLQETEEAPAAILHNGAMFVHTRRNNVVLLGIAAGEGSTLLALEELLLIARVLTSYLKEFSEYTLRENFSIVYQLLQEVLDSGYPLNTEAYSLEELVPKPTLENKVRSLLDTTTSATGGGASSANGATGRGPVGGIRASSNLSRNVLGYGGGTGAGVPWRDVRTHHTTNEILFDVVESLDYIIDCDGRIVKATVRGAVEVNCRLSGMPDVLLRLAHTDVVDDVGLHRCVRVPKYENDKVISFVPPDGRFTLMNYTCKPTLAPPLPPFYVTPQVTFGPSGGRFNCMVGHRCDAGYTVRDDDREVQRIIIRLILPPGTAAMTVLNCSKGTTSFDRSKSVLTWSLGSLGRMTPSLGGEFVFETAEAAKAAMPGTGSAALVDFEIPNYVLSGLRVDSVHVQNEVGKPYKGVKYMTRSGSFSVRTV